MPLPHYISLVATTVPKCLASIVVIHHHFIAFQVPLEAKEIVLTEGEYDAMAVYQASALLSFAPFCDWPSTRPHI